MTNGGKWGGVTARCGGSNIWCHDVAESKGNDRLRVARTKCMRCGASRKVYFRLQTPRLN